MKIVLGAINVSILFLVCVQSCSYLPKGTIEQRLRLKEAAQYNVQLGLAYLKQGDRPRAKRKLLIALDLAPNFADAITAMAYYFEQTGDLEDAQAYYLKALALAPTSGAQLNSYGAFLCRRGDYSEAETYFLKAVKDKSYTHTAGAYENAGLCASYINDYNKAKKFFAKALNQDQERNQSLHELVKLELRQGNPKLALKHLQRYPMLTLSDPILLRIGIDAAHETNKVTEKKFYQKGLQSLNQRPKGENQ